MLFVHAGYLVQEPYETGIPHRQGFALATMDTGFREVPAALEKPALHKVGERTNPTILLLDPPDMTAYPGYVLNAYALESVWIDRLTMDFGVRQAHEKAPTRFAYARGLTRCEDDLQLLGYEIMDGMFEFLSILNNCGYSVEQVRLAAGPLNHYGMFDELETAQKFVDFARKDPQLDPHNEAPIIWQVWGQPIGERG